MRVLRQSVQAAPPHEGPLPGAHGGAALPLHPVREDVLALHHPQGAREDALPKVRSEVPVLTDQPSGHGGGGPGAAAVVCVCV